MAWDGFHDPVQSVLLQPGAVWWGCRDFDGADRLCSVRKSQSDDTGVIGGVYRAVHDSWRGAVPHWGCRGKIQRVPESGRRPDPWLRGTADGNIVGCLCGDRHGRRGGDPRAGQSDTGAAVDRFSGGYAGGDGRGLWDHRGWAVQWNNEADHKGLCAVGWHGVSGGRFWRVRPVQAVGRISLPAGGVAQPARRAGALKKGISEHLWVRYGCLGDAAPKQGE